MKLIQNMNLRSNPILFQGFSLLCISRIPAHQFIFPVYLAGITEDDVGGAPLPPRRPARPGCGTGEIHRLYPVERQGMDPAAYRHCQALARHFLGVFA